MAEIVVCGGGHLGHALAAVLSAQHPTALLTGRPFAAGLIVARTRTLVVAGMPELVTSDAELALQGAHVVLIAAPCYAHSGLLLQIAPFVPRDAWVGALPAVGWFHEKAQQILGRTKRVFGTREAPYNCRVVQRGAIVDIFGVVPKIGVAAVVSGEAPAAANLLADLLAIPTEVVSHPIAAMLRPVNVALHPVGFERLIRAALECGPFARPPAFYGMWDDRSSCRYLAIGEELADVAAASRLCHPNEIDPVPRHYGTSNPAELTARIRSLDGLKAIGAPVIPADSGYMPDFESRFVVEDAYVGLAAAIDIGQRANVPTTGMSELLKEIMHHEAAFARGAHAPRR